MSERPPEDQPPSWLAQPAEEQPPAATPEIPSAPIRATYREQHPQQRPQQRPPDPAPADDGFSFSIGGYQVTGWQAAALIAVVLTVVSASAFKGVVANRAAFTAYSTAPACGAVVQDSCLAEFSTGVTGYQFSASSNCSISTVSLAKGPSWDGVFPADACNGLSAIVPHRGSVDVWQGQLVYFARNGSEYWAYNNAVGEYERDIGGAELFALLDGVFVLAVIFALLFRLRTRARR